MTFSCLWYGYTEIFAHCSVLLYVIIEIFADLFTCTDLSDYCCTFCYQQCISVCFLQIYTGWLILSFNAQETFWTFFFAFLVFFAVG